MGLAETADLSVRIGLDDRLTPGLGRALGSLNRFNSGLGRAGRGVGTLAGGIARAGVTIGALAGGALAAVARAAINFDDAFAGVRKTVNQTDLTKAGLSFEMLARQFRDLATVIPVSADDLARIGEEAGALGIRAQDITAFTEVVAKLGVTTNLSTDAAAEALGKVGSILHLTGRQFNDFADTLVNLGNNGASTESEIIDITKRFAAAGRQAGLSANQILGLASATASLGIEPEAAGGALSRLFGNMAANIALANSKGKAFSKLVGEPIGKLQKDINQGKGLTLFLKMLQEIKGLSKVDAAKTLHALGITNVRDRDAILKLAQNYGLLNDQLQTAEQSTGALGKEAEKRFATVKSSLQLLRNNLIEAALTIGGEGNDPTSFIGSIGVAAKKLSAFLKNPANKRDLEAFGKKLGAAITGIDFDKLLTNVKGIADVLKPALDTLLKIADTIAKLPPEVLGAGGGLLIANQLSGGAIGSGLGGIIGGLGEVFAKSLVARVPLFGSAFVQPVFVTNMGLGGLGGGGGVSGAGGAAGGIAPLLPKAGLGEIAGGFGAAGILVAVQSGVADGIRQANVVGNQDLTDRQARVLTDFWAPGLEALTNLDKLPGAIADDLNGLLGGSKAAPVATDKATLDNLYQSFRAGERTAGATDVHIQQGFRAGERATADAAERTREAIARVVSIGSRAVSAVDASKSVLAGKLGDSNAKLGRIASKKTSFTVRNAVTVQSTTAVSVRDTTKTTSTYRSFVKTNGLEIR